nr:hypothetical protein [Tanacetum cinerariifolium]
MDLLLNLEEIRFTRSPAIVLENKKIEISSDDPHASSVEMYLLDEEDDGDNVVVPETPSEEIINKFNDTSVDRLLLFLMGFDRVKQISRTRTSCSIVYREASTSILAYFGGV